MADLTRFCGDCNDCEIVIKKKKLGGSYFWFGRLLLVSNKMKTF
jgi:hypothetical protein